MDRSSEIDGVIYGTFEGQGSQEITTLMISEPDQTRRGSKNSRAKVIINRPAYSIQELESWATEDDFVYERPKVKNSSNDSKIACCPSNSCCAPHRIKNWLFGVLPILAWLPKYNFSKNLFSDIVAGSTVAIMQVPQGMAYAMLASVPPVVGLYTSFFPGLVYFFFGTSRHGSIGTFALISMMTNTAMEDVLSDLRSHSHSTRSAMDNGTMNGSSVSKGYFLPEITPDLDPIDVAVVVAFLVGIIEIIMGLARMGSLTVLMSDQMISGLITGTAVQVLTSQLKPMTGVKIAHYSGAFNTVLSWVSFLERIATINWEIVLVTTISLSFLILVKFLIDPVFKRKLKVPFPAELILVIIGTAVSHHFHFKEEYDIDIIGTIPTGLVSPKIPHLQLIPKLLTGGAMVSIVGVSLSLSIVMSYGKKHNYTVESNQELLAYGLANAVSSFFSCIPCSISLSRSAVLETSGGKSQLSMLVSCAFLLVVILLLGPLFSALPDAILSAIIVVALRSMFAGVSDLAVSWKTSKCEALVWLVTFLGVIVLDIDYGLAIGVVVSLATVLYHAHRPTSTTVLGQLEKTNIYVDLQRFRSSASELKGVKIICMPGPLYFGNRDIFRTQVLALSDLLDETVNRPAVPDFSGSCNVKMDESQRLLPKFKKSMLLHHVVLDCTAMSFIDSGGVGSLVQLSDELLMKGAILFLAGIPGCVMKMVENCGIPSGLTKSHMFPTVHDAVMVAIQEYSDNEVTSEYICL